MNDPREHFTGLYNRYYQRVLRYALQHVDPGVAEDVVDRALEVAGQVAQAAPIATRLTKAGLAQRSSSLSLSGLFSHSFASGKASLRTVMTGHDLASSLFSAVNCS